MIAARDVFRLCTFLFLVSQSLASPLPHGKPVCEVSVKERIDCGHPYITYEECNAKGCCFDYSNRVSKSYYVPPCYYGNQCIGCTYTNGVGYNPNPFDCSTFYQCTEGRPSRTVLQHCPKGLHWSQNKLTCTYPAQADCKAQTTSATWTSSSTPAPTLSPLPTKYANCKAYPGSGPYPHEHLCDTYVTCVGSTRQEQCCPLPLVWDSYSRVCVYANQHYSGCKRGCSNSTPLECSGQDVVTCYPFTNSLSDQSRNKFYTQVTATTLVHGKAYFNGRNSKLEVPGFRNIFNGKSIKNLAIDLDFSFVGGFYGKQGLVFKGDCNHDPTFGIIINSNGNQTTLEAFVNHPDTKVIYEYIFPYTSYNVAMRYDGYTISLRVNGRVVVARAASGVLKSNHASLFLGFADCGYSGSLNGYIDQVVIRAS